MKQISEAGKMQKNSTRDESGIGKLFKTITSTADRHICGRGFAIAGGFGLACAWTLSYPCQILNLR